MRSHIRWHTCVLAPVVLLLPFRTTFSGCRGYCIPYPISLCSRRRVLPVQRREMYIDDKVSPIFRVFIATVVVAGNNNGSTVLRELFRCKRGRLSKRLGLNYTD